jgi:hypothetical protein
MSSTPIVPATLTVPGQSLTAAHYQDYMILYTDGEEVRCTVDGAPPGPNGRLFIVPTGKATKVPWEAGRFILDHLAYTGVVRVNEVNNEDGTGTTYDLEFAKAESIERFKEADQKRWEDYITYCVTDKLSNPRGPQPIPPTPDSIKNVMKRRGYKLSDYGITTVGEVRTIAGSDEIKLLREQVAALTARLAEALGDDPAPAPVSKKKGK